MKLYKYFLFLSTIPIFLGCPKLPNTGEEENTIFVSADPNPDLKGSDKSMPFRNNDLKWLTDNSPLIFQGSLDNQSTDRDQNGLIFTNNVFSIKRQIKGDYEKESINIQTLGGKHKGEVMSVSHMPAFYKNLEYILFMDPNKKIYSPVTANEAGVFIVATGNIYTCHGQSLTAIEDNKLITGNNKINLPTEDRKTAVIKINEELPKTSSPDLQIETIDISKIAESEAIISLEKFIETIQLFFK